MLNDRCIKQLVSTKAHAIFPERAEWTEGALPYSSQDLVFYTDGSLMNDLAGAGVFCPELEISLALPLGKWATVFQAEVHAIQEALYYCTKSRVCNRTIVVCSDSQAAIKAIIQTETVSTLVKECKAILNDLSARNQVKLLWVPGHEGIHGNEEADLLARQGSSQQPFGPEPTLPLAWSQTRSCINQWVKKRFSEEWRKQTLKHSLACIPAPSLKVTNELLGHSRNVTRRVVALLTGHGPFRAHLSRIGVSVNPECRYCETENETGWHILAECQAVWRARLNHLGCAVSNEGCPPEISPSRLGRFIQAINLE
jgi:ribonuclease HI